MSFLLRSGLGLLLVKIAVNTAAQPFGIVTPAARLTLSSTGQATRWRDVRHNVSMPLRTNVTLLGMRQTQSHPVALQAGVSFRRIFTNGQDSCRVEETFRPDGDAVRWEVTVTGLSSRPFSVPINSQMQVPADRLFWTTWGDPRMEQTDGESAGSNEAAVRQLLDGNRIASPVLAGNAPATDWADPLIPQPFADRRWWYGAPKYDPVSLEPLERSLYFSPTRTRAIISVPVLAALHPASSSGLSLALSPDDVGVEVIFRTSGKGVMTVERHNNRILPDKPVLFTAYLYPHEAEWRGALRGYVARFRSYFDPVNPQAQDFAGTVAYSYERANLDTAKLRQMAFRTNWDAAFAFPYMGLFLPPVADSVQWLGWRGLPHSLASINQQYASYWQAGFHTLSYFNVTEFGNYIVPKAEYVPRRDWREVWINPNHYLQTVLEPAVVYQPTDTTHSRYVYTNERTIVVDPAEPVYQQMLLDQLWRHVRKLPNFEGVAIDRLDWLRMYQTRADDGRSWFMGKPARSLHSSWKTVIDTLHRVLHSNGKVLFINTHVKRIEQARYVDGVFDEFGYAGASMNANAFLCLNKPLLGWCSDTTQIGQHPDFFMQRYLHIGMFPMAPYPANDHALLPDAQTEQLYVDYGPLFDALRGKQWVLSEKPVALIDGRATINLFRTNEGYLLPVTFGQTSRVTLRLGNLSEPIREAEWRGPGQTRWQTVAITKGRIELPLTRGCAVVRLRTR